MTNPDLGHPTVRVTHGPNDAHFPNIVGKSAASVRRGLASAFSIPTDAVAYVGGSVVEPNYKVRAGDEIEFLVRRGRKAALSQEELEKFNLPKEVTTEEAGQILEISKHTVLKLLDDGLLEWRNAAPSSSSRPVYRISLQSVLALRTEYRRGGTRPNAPEAKPRRRPRAGSPTPYKVKHLRRKELP